MRIAASLSVKDEAELIEPAIRHLRTIGVDHIIACDMHSTDGTYEILEKYRSDDDFWLFRMLEDTDDDFGDAWTRANVALAKATGADWVLFLDADEFLLPRTGSLRDCQDLAAADVLLIERLNMPPGPRPPVLPDDLRPSHYDGLLLIAQPFANPHLHLEQDPTAAWIRAKQDPKMMVRPERIGSLTLGGHDVIAGDAAPLRRVKPADLVIAHLPMTTHARFLRKMDNVRRSFGTNFAELAFGAGDDGVPVLAWHWQRWLILAEQGRLDEEFGRNLFDLKELAKERDSGVIRSVAELFRDGIP